MLYLHLDDSSGYSGVEAKDLLNYGVRHMVTPELKKNWPEIDFP
jgi:hypothetical protein